MNTSVREWVAYISLLTRQFIIGKVKNLSSRQAEVGNPSDSGVIVGFFASSYDNIGCKREQPERERLQSAA